MPIGAKKNVGRSMISPIGEKPGFRCENAGALAVTILKVPGDSEGL